MKWVHVKEYDTLELDFDVPANLKPCMRTYIWIERRPHYCDRGHYIAKIAAPDIDGADLWPRYYFDLERAKSECEDFVKWRYEKKGEEHGAGRSKD